MAFGCRRKAIASLDYGSSCRFELLGNKGSTNFSGTPLGCQGKIDEKDREVILRNGYVQLNYSSACPEVLLILRMEPLRGQSIVTRGVTNLDHCSTSCSLCARSRLPIGWNNIRGTKLLLLVVLMCPRGQSSEIRYRSVANTTGI